MYTHIMCTNEFFPQLYYTNIISLTFFTKKLYIIRVCKKELFLFLCVFLIHVPVQNESLTSVNHVFSCLCLLQLDSFPF